LVVKFSISKIGKQNSLVMRFSQPTTWNVQKGDMEVFKTSEGNKIHDITK
jgi:hypothetical protein